MDLAKFCRQVLVDEESQESFDNWLDHAYDKSIRPEDVDLEALEAELRACDGVEWGIDEFSQFNWTAHEIRDDDDGRSSQFDMNWLQEYNK